MEQVHRLVKSCPAGSGQSAGSSLL